jgi:hypothetical protein
MSAENNRRISVCSLRKSNDKDAKILADIEFDFDQSEEDPLRHLRAIVESGRISGMEVSPNYFVIFSKSLIFIEVY